ncbi:polysaccharide biosynthesis protein PslG [Frankia sp. AiPs1]|uniref:cellulase family glycosylhydrolase n=1 Tax=Frankia sp. AiPa1 TaxID=573492 RepID=UPI00202AE52F|nr:cellulase family glycosylhydrolase [Frankia sp. AiPa1]MCL9758322.1 cellulase family glycosylhydrolase [Frankia sp. AiPa1]
MAPLPERGRRARRPSARHRGGVAPVSGPAHGGHRPTRRVILAITVAAVLALVAVVSLGLCRPGDDGPKLLATLSADQVVVTGHGFPKQTGVDISASTGGYGGRGVAHSTRDGRLSLRFRLPSHFSGTVQLQARTKNASTGTSLWIPFARRGPATPSTPEVPASAATPSSATAEPATSEPAVPSSPAAQPTTDKAADKGTITGAPAQTAASAPTSRPTVTGRPGPVPQAGPSTAPAIPGTVAIPGTKPEPTMVAGPVSTSPAAQPAASATTTVLAPTTVAGAPAGSPKPVSPSQPVPLLPGDLWAATNGGRAPAYGVNTHPLRPYQSSDYGAQFTRFAGIGASWIRADANWGALEPNAGGQYNAAELAKLDQVVTTARSNNLNLLLILLSPPGWAGAPNNTGPLRSLAQFLATRYKSDGNGPMVAFEMWNEPNAIGNSMSPATYTKLACAGFEGVRASGTRAPVVVGALAMNNWNPWLSQAFDAGLGNCMDVLSIHPYEGSDYIPASHQIMVDHGVGDRPIWYTEFGWSTCSDCATETSQSSKVIGRIEEARAKYPYVTVVMQYEDRDEPSVSPAIEQHFGIFHADSAGRATTPKPVFDALKSYLAEQK